MFTDPRSIARTLVAKKYIVSTVDLGRFYETMVFHADKNGEVTDWMDLDCARYPSQGFAEAGHRRIVAKWRKKAKV